MRGPIYRQAFANPLSAPPARDAYHSHVLLSSSRLLFFSRNAQQQHFPLVFLLLCRAAGYQTSALHRSCCHRPSERPANAARLRRCSVRRGVQDACCVPTAHVGFAFPICLIVSFCYLLRTKYQTIVNILGFRTLTIVSKKKTKFLI